VSGIFPYSTDGGIPPNAQTPNNPAQAFIHQHALPADTSALYYGNGCDVRLRPHVVNSLISEIAAVADRAGVAYRAASLQNLEVSIRYLIQRGLPHSGMLVAQTAFQYAITLDPVPPYYTDFLTIVFVPQLLPGATQNQGYVRINVNGLGYVPLYRNDGEEVRAGDILSLKPFIATYFNGAFHMIGLCASQVPLVKYGGLDAWVRTDGNDVTGDGTANSPDKAFRTLNGAWEAVGSRYMATPLFSVNFKLGIPGTYEAGVIGPFGSTMTITGDEQNRGAYRIGTKFYPGSNVWISLQTVGVAQMAIAGVTLQIANTSNPAIALWNANSHIELRNVNFDAMTSNPAGIFIANYGGASTGIAALATTQFNGNGNEIGAAIDCQSGRWAGCGDVSRGNLMSSNFDCGAFITLSSLSVGVMVGTNFFTTNVTGKQFSVSTNSVLYQSNASGPIPGDEAGVWGTGGVFVP